MASATPDTIDDGDTWAANGTFWMTETGGLEVWPEMYLEVTVFATSTNTVRAWLIA